MNRPRALWARTCELLQRDRVMMPLTLLSIAGYLGARFDRRWIPHDEGLLAQSAERVLQGQWPHRDFDDPYTGGLTLLHAAAMQVLGVNLVSPRWLLLIAAAALSAVLFRIARRAADPVLAAFVTWLGIAWSIPNYFASLPSWYNLTFAAAGLLCLLRFIERERWVDLAAAGALGGLSFLLKSVGLYYVAACLLTLVFMTVIECERADAIRGTRFEGWLVRAALALFAGLLISMVGMRASLMERLHFTLPGLLLVGVLAAGEVRLARRRQWLSVRSLLGRCLVFMAGVAVPIAIFLVPYLATHTLDAFVYGVFVAPQRRVGGVSAALPALPSLIAALPCLVLLLGPLIGRSVPDRPRTWLIVIVLGSCLLALGDSKFAYRGVWLSVRPLVPCAAIACTLALLAREQRAAPAIQRAQLFASAAIAAFVSLVQFPYAYAIYFFYAAPLIVLSLLFIIRSQPSAPRRTWLVVGVFHLGFALLWLNTGHLRRLGTSYVADDSDTRLELPRGGLQVERRFAEIYTRLTREVQAHSPPNAYIYAAPDCPEVYFLTGRRNPTRTFYDIFDRDFLGDPSARARRILDSLEQHGVDVCVIQLHPEFSGHPQPALMQALVERYPHATSIPPLFTVRFRDPPRVESRNGHAKGVNDSLDMRR